VPAQGPAGAGVRARRHLRTGWGIGAFANPHGIYIANDVVYLTDREDSVCLTYTLDGKPLQVLGTRGRHSDTGCERPGDLVPHAAGPFNGCDRENNRVQVFTADGQFVAMWTDLRRPLDISIDRDGLFHVSEGGVSGLSSRISLMDRDGAVVARWDSLSAHGSWVDAHGDIYLALGVRQRVDKYVRRR
jgi:hypothetical protein